MTLVFVVLVFWVQFAACVSALARNTSLIGDNFVDDDRSCQRFFCMKDESAGSVVDGGPSARELFSMLLLGTGALCLGIYVLLTDDETKEPANDNPAANDRDMIAEDALLGQRPPVVQERGDKSILNRLSNGQERNAAKSVNREELGAWRSNSTCAIACVCVGMVVCIAAIASLVMCVHAMEPSLSEEIYERVVPVTSLEENSWVRMLNSLAAKCGFSPAIGYEAFAAYHDSRREESVQWAELAVDRSATALAVAAACVADGHSGPCDTDRGLAMALESCRMGSAFGYATALRIYLHRGDVAGASTLVNEYDTWTISASSPGIYDAMAYRAVYEYQRGNTVAALRWGERSERLGGNFLGASVIAMVACDAHEYEECLAWAKKGITHDHHLAYIAMLRHHIEGGEEVDRTPSLDMLQFLARNEYDRKQLGEFILEYAIGLDPSRRLVSRNVEDMDPSVTPTSRDRMFYLMQWYLTHASEVFGNGEAKRLLQRSVRDESTPCFSCATTGIRGHVLSLKCNNFEEGPHPPPLENDIRTTLLPRRMHANEGADGEPQQSPLSCRNVHGEGVFHFAVPDGISVYPTLSWLDWQGHPIQAGEAVGYGMDHFSVEVWVKPERELTKWCDTLGPGCGMLLFPSHGRDTKSGIGISAGTNAICVQGHYSNHMPCYLKYTGDLSGWTHVIVTVSNVNVLDLYVNGSLEGTRIVEREALLLPYRLNVWETSYGAYIGDAASVNIWDRSLSSDEVHQRYIEAHARG